MMSKWQVSGANGKTGALVVETFEAKSGRAAEDEARRTGILISSITPLHDDTAQPSKIVPDASALSRADWRKLEWTITKGVCGGVLLLFILQAATLFVLYLVVASMRVP